MGLKSEIERSRKMQVITAVFAKGHGFGLVKIQDSQYPTLKRFVDYGMASDRTANLNVLGLVHDIHPTSEGIEFARQMRDINSSVRELVDMSNESLIRVLDQVFRKY